MAILHDVFISYSHAADVSLARALETGLEKLAKPLFRLRAIDAFRDESSLTASPGLWPGIAQHLSGSQWFILLASTSSAASAWCHKEILWWLENRSLDRMLFILTDGELLWDSTANDFDWTRTTALSPSLRQRFHEEPSYVDMRWARDQTVFSLANPRFRNAVVDIAAPVRGMRKDDLDSEDVRQHRRNRILVRAGVTAVAVAAALAVWQAVVANRERRTAVRERDNATAALAEARAQREKANRQTEIAEANQNIANFERSRATAAQTEAERQRDEAVRQRDAARSRRLAVQADATSPGDVSVLLAIESLRRTRFVETDALLRRLIRERPKALASDAIPGTKSSDSFYAWTFSPRGTYFVAGGTANTATLWHSTTLKEFAQFTVGGTSKIAFSPDESLLAIAAVTSNGVVLHSLADRTSRAVMQGLSDISSLAFSPDGRLLAAGLSSPYALGRPRNGHVVTDVTTGAQIGGLRSPTITGRVAFSPDGQYLATGQAPRTVVLWASALGFATPSATYDDVVEWEFDPGTGNLLVVNRDRMLRVHSPAGLDVASRWNLDDVDAFDISSDGARLAAVRKGSIEVRSRDGSELHSIALSMPELTTFEFRDEGRKLLVTGRSGTRLIDVPDRGDAIAVDRERSAWSPDGRMIATLEGTLSDQKRVQFWEATGGESAARMRHDDSVCTVSFDKVGRRLVSASKDGTARVWRVPDGRELHRLRHKAPVTAAWFSPDGTTVVSAGEGEANWWRTDSGAPVAATRYTGESARYFGSTGGCAHDRGTLAVAFAGQDAMLAVATGRRAEVWNLRTGVRVVSVEHSADPDPLSNESGLRVDLSPDGTVLATSNFTTDGPIRLWQVPSGDLLRKLQSLSGSGISAVQFGRWQEAFTPDRRYVVKVGRFDGVPNILQAWDGQVFSQIDTRRGLNAAAFSPEGSYLAMATDRIARLLFWRTEDLIHDACQRVARNLTRTEWDKYVGLGPRQPTCPEIPE